MSFVIAIRNAACNWGSVRFPPVHREIRVGSTKLHLPTSFAFPALVIDNNNSSQNWLVKGTFVVSDIVPGDSIFTEFKRLLKQRTGVSYLSRIISKAYGPQPQMELCLDSDTILRSV